MRYKYNRTYHLPWSPGATSDDKIIHSVEHFIGHDVIVTEKMDGENTTIYSDGTCHARSLDSGFHPSRTWIYQLAGQIGYQIPTNWRICGENLFAEHSIHYTNLSTYFMVFGIYDENNICLNWDDTKEYCQMLDLQTVPELYRGQWDEELIKKCYKQIGNYGIQEGYVVRKTQAFSYDDFNLNVAKWVRSNHVQTDEHWSSKSVIQNTLK